MGRISEEEAALVVEQAEAQSLSEAKNPMVLSCGGIFIPRPQPMANTIYQILNVANTNEPTKIVVGSVPKNLLQEVLHKESLN